jgi:AhpD family alkylhydroperoxidase
MHQSRVRLSKSAPELFETAVQFERQASDLAASAGLGRGFTHLLRLRASQLNGCAYCVRMHTRDALASGETTDRISVLPAWRETAYFTDKERAALALMEAVTLIAEGQIPDAVYDQAAGLLSDDEIVAVEWLGVVINVWNRIAIPSRTPVAP